MSLEVIELRMPASFQDLGRPGLRLYGVPRGGAFDETSFVNANRLLGNLDATPAMEVTLLGGKFRAIEKCRVAVTGASATITLNDRDAKMSTLIEVQDGDVLEIGAPRSGVRNYLAIQGGFKVDRVLGSCSGIPVRRGDRLVVEGNPISLNAVTSPRADVEGPFRVVLADNCSRQDRDVLVDRPFIVSNLSNRVGIRLSGPPLEVLPDVTSEPVCIGTIQVTNNGQLIIIGPDGPTIGGYRKAAVVIKADHSRLGQLSPDQEVVFKTVTLEDARERSAKQMS